MKFIVFIFIFLLNYNHFTYSLTFKSDGTVINSDGTYLKEPPFLQYQKALHNYLKGEPVPEGWPVVELDENNNPIKVKGYFGEKILAEGSPLFSIPKSLNGDIIKNLSLQNGLLKDHFGAILVSNSNSEWRQDAEIDQQIYEESKKYASYLAETDFMAFKLQELTDNFIEFEILKKASKQFLLNNPDDKMAKIEFKREMDSKLADFSNKLNDYFELSEDATNNLLNELSFKLEDLTNEFNHQELKDILQLEIKNNIEITSDIFIEDLNYSRQQVETVIDSKEGEAQTKNEHIGLAEEIVKKSQTIDIIKNVDTYKKYFEKINVDQSNMLPDEWISVLKQIEEYPGASFDKFNTLASLQEGFQDFNELSADFKKSVENAITAQGAYSIEEGLKNLKRQDLHNQFAKLIDKQLSGQDFDKQLKDKIQNELAAVERELGIDNIQPTDDCANNAAGDPDAC